MTCTTWRNALAATGAALAASSLMLAGCSKGDQSDYSDANPGAVTRATDSADAGMSGPAAASSGVSSDTSSVVSTARTVPSASGGVGPSPSLGDAGAPAPPPSVSNPSSNPDSGATTGKATGPRG